ncbi:MAG: hypothetical protein Q8L53_16815 [Aestuariivirga sp.]|nr:hypothetical protein [Aestuariivirga sp.]
MSYDDDKMELPHGFQVQKLVPKDTGVLNPEGKKIFKNPEPIGYVQPRHYAKFFVKPE